MLKLFTGYQNDGKSISAAVDVTKDYMRGRTIYSNTWLNFPHYMINKDFLLYIVDQQINIPNATFFLDEFWIWADSRKRDATLSYFYLQTSKDNINIFMTAQTGRQNDIRLRDNLHYWVECQRKFLYQGKIRDIPDKYRDLRTVEDGLPQFISDNIVIKSRHNRPSSGNREYWDCKKTTYLMAKKFYSLYNTRAKIKR